MFDRERESNNVVKFIVPKTIIIQSNFDHDFFLSNQNHPTKAMKKVDETLQLKKPKKFILKGFKRRCFILKYSEIEENKNLISTLLE